MGSKVRAVSEEVEGAGKELYRQHLAAALARIDEQRRRQIEAA
jgi:hypothetical protein